MAKHYSAISSKPSSSGGLAKENSYQGEEEDERRSRPQSLRQPSEMKAGGTPGHKGSALEQIKYPHKVVVANSLSVKSVAKTLSHIKPDHIEGRCL